MHRTSDTDKPLRHLDSSIVAPPPVGATLLHYKGGLYTVTGQCTIESTLEPGLLYQSVDPLARQDVWLRPVSNVFAEISAGVHRFSAVHTPTGAAVRRALQPVLKSQQMVDFILQPYRNPARAYHGLTRIFGMFETAEALRLRLSKEQVLALALHDVEYIAGAPAGVNETASVLHMRSLEKAGFSKGPVDWGLVAQIIMDTATHVPSCAPSMAVLALDLSCLAGTPAEFAVTNERIWLENRHLFQGLLYPRKEFDDRRLAVLEHLVAGGPVFTGEFAQWEPLLHTNLAALRR